MPNGRRQSTTNRAATGMVRLRRRFVQSENLGNSESVDAEEDFKPCVYEDGERGYLINEVGIKGRHQVSRVWGYRGG